MYKHHMHYIFFLFSSSVYSKRGKKKEPLPVTDFASAAISGTAAASGNKKKRGGKGKGVTKLEDVENLLLPGRVECDCQGTIIIE